MDDYIGSGGSTTGAALNMFSGIANGLVNFGFNSYLMDKQNVYNHAMYDRMRRDSIDFWNMTNDYNTPAAVRARKEAAGYNALDEMSINPAQPINVPNGSSGVQMAPANFSNPYKDYLQAKLVESQIDKNEADARNTDEDTHGLELDNQFKEDTIEARKLGLDLENRVREANIHFTEEQRKEVSANIEKLKAEAKTEEEKQFLYRNEAKLAEANAGQVAALTPLLEQYWAAKTTSEQAYASYTFVQAATQQGLLDAGWIDETIKSVQESYNLDIAQAKSEVERQRLIKEQRVDSAIGNAIKLGKVYDDNKFTGRLANRFIRATSIAGQALGPFTGVVGAYVGGRQIGRGSKTVSPVPGQPGGAPKYPSLYGADGKPIMYN